MYYYLIILDIVHWLFGFGSVGLHNIIMHQCLGPKKAKTTWATHNRTKNMLSSFLKDMPNPIFKFLVTIQESWAHLLGINKYIIRNLEKNNIEKKKTYWMYSSTCSTNSFIFFHQINKKFHCTGLKIYVTIQS